MKNRPSGLRWSAVFFMLAGFLASAPYRRRSTGLDISQYCRG
jgi:hypothetical protein